MPAPSVSDDFMDGVWMRAGQLEERSSERARLALFAAMAFVGLGAGIGATAAPASAETAGFRLVDGADLSPAALLHVEP
ncbi:MAG: hypothetical protein EP345_04710 [Sphingomonadales bacterium]|nr:MAG: hypothetical protein EP345_04710 [Sphingomonadales bacterium]